MPLQGEKHQSLPSNTHALTSPPRSRKKFVFLQLALLTGLALAIGTLGKRALGTSLWKDAAVEYLSNAFDCGQLDLCQQEEPLIPRNNAELWRELDDAFGTEEFEARAIGWLAGAVKYP